MSQRSSITNVGYKIKNILFAKKKDIEQKACNPLIYSIEEEERMPDTELTKIMRAKKIREAQLLQQKEEEKKAIQKEISEKIKNAPKQSTLYKNSIMYFGRNLSLQHCCTQALSPFTLKTMYNIT